MKIGIRIAVSVVVLLAVGFGLLAFLNRPLSQEAVNEKIDQRLSKIVKRNDALSSVLLTIYSGQTGYFQQFAVGTKNKVSVEPAQIDSQYHTASIGKTMCAAIYGMLVDEGKISFDDSITAWLDDDTVNGLFEIDGIDYSDQVTIRHLLNHTSGVGDYFAGPVNSGNTMLDIILSDPDRFFTPQELVAFTRDNQHAVGKPGQQFYYSDTGYILLGLILETIEGKSYADILEEKIFEPLKMDSSYLMFSPNKPTDILGIYVDGIDLSNKHALSVDWAGGGVVTTMDDLLTFMIAMESGTLLSAAVYEQMTDFSYRYEKGIYYGMGMMYFDFSELSFLLGSMPDVYGGVGATGSYVLYDSQTETYFIANFGSLGFAQKGIEELVKIRMIYDRMKVE